MVNKEFTKDVAKAIKDSSLGGSKELTPGVTPRRYEPAGGVRQHNERIHRESKWVDANKNLPFSFSKPKKPTRGAIVRCLNCGRLTTASINTVGIICVGCNTYSAVEEVIDD